MIDAKRIWSSSQLPTLPSVAVRLLELARDPETEFGDVIQVVKTDPAITAKILKAANSSFFGFKSPVTSIERAVPLLGTTVVTTLALSFSLADGSTTSGPLSRHYLGYWKQSIVQAVASEVLAQHYAQTLASECFLTGLLLDLGRLAMLKTVSKEYLEVLEEWDKGTVALGDLEKATLGIDHMEVGAELMRSWKLPQRLIHAVANHHAPPNRLLSEFSDESALMERAVAVGACVGDYFCTGTKGTALERIRHLSSGFFQFTPATLEEYLQRTRERIDRAGDLFSVSFAELGNCADFMAEANEQLARLAVREHMATTQMELEREAFEQARQELTEKNEQLRERATRDPLTGLYNRSVFAEALATAITAAGGAAAPVAVVFSDVDHFKLINDTYGHHFGDEVLRDVARLHASVLRQTDIVARYGGEEFVVLVSQPTVKGLERLSERLRQAVADASFSAEGQPVRVTISIGAAIALPDRDPGDLALRLVAAADEAMYESKQNGRNQVHVRSLIDEFEREVGQLAAQKRFSRWLVQNNVFDIPTISQALIGTQVERARIGALAQRMDYLTVEHLEQIRVRQETTGERFGRCAVECGLLTKNRLAILLAIQAEPPASLAQTLTRLRLLDAARADSLLSEYRATLEPTSAAPSPAPAAPSSTPAAASPAEAAAPVVAPASVAAIA